MLSSPNGACWGSVMYTPRQASPSRQMPVCVSWSSSSCSLWKLPLMSWETVASRSCVSRTPSRPFSFSWSSSSFSTACLTGQSPPCALSPSIGSRSTIRESGLRL